MNYIGSKRSLLNFLDKSIHKIIDPAKCQVFADLFAGTGVVGTHFKKKGYRLISNDIQYYSYILNRHYLGNNDELKFNNLILKMPELRHVNIKDRRQYLCDYLTSIKGRPGFIYENYCAGGTKNKSVQRLYYSDENGLKCDALRQLIESWKKQNHINDNEYYYLLACLIDSVDAYANTASVYSAFLKSLKPTAQRSLKIKALPLIKSNLMHDVYNQNIDDLISNIKCDILYLDPPYNRRQYATNYHVLETIAKYDNPILTGKTGLREYEAQKSLYCLKKKVKNALKNLIVQANSKYIFLSYNNEGVLRPGEIKTILSKKGKYGCFTQKYSRFKADKDHNRSYVADQTIEYLHYVIVK
ncbi:DNA adenine methylase [bacterium]|nr:DNA adenine methylase [bacterium]MBT3581077.1 DNA adenine methylase [bacterium]MBT4552254.1 DNA adenine methylase [bacterium]MBT7087880.1 DNA adenine methylase [bacterium]